MRFLQLLLRGISSDAVEGDDTALKLFRIEVSHLSERLTDQLSSTQMLAVIGEVIDSLAEYNKRAAKLEAATKAEVRTLLTMMTDTIAFLAASSTTDVERPTH